MANVTITSLRGILLLLAFLTVSPLALLIHIPLGLMWLASLVT